MKYKMFIILIFCISILILITGCLNTPEYGITVEASRLHIVGDYGSWNTAFYWNDGELTVLDTPDGDFHVSASSITVNEGKVYVGGEYDGKPCYWIDSVRYDIACDSGRIAGIAVDGSGRLILAGSCDDEGSIWVDGVRTSLSVPSGCRGVVNAMSVFNDVVYLAGICIDEAWEQVPCYWVDGVYTALPEPSQMSPGGEARTSGITLKDTKVLVSGSYDSEMDDEGAGYWIDGTWNDLDGTTARAVASSGNRICVVGRDSLGACFWLDDRKEELQAVYSTIATAAASAGNVIAAAGKCGPTGGDDTLGYWSGGDFFEIYEDGIADVNAMYISD